jgi:hypothetical protein
LLFAGTASAATPTLGQSASSVDLRNVMGTVAYGDGHAVPLRAARPSWYTADLAAGVHAADGQPVAAPTDAPLPGEVGIRPGPG